MLRAALDDRHVSIMASENSESMKSRRRSRISAGVPVFFAILLLASPMATSASAQTHHELRTSVAALQDSVVSLARGQVGKRYVFGGARPEIGFDCSGLLQYVWRAFQIDLPRNSAAQASVGVPVPRDISKLRVGDLLTFGHGGRVSHIGIYTGKGKFVHASTGSRRVVESLLERPPSRRIKPWIGARRLRVAITDGLEGQ